MKRKVLFAVFAFLLVAAGCGGGGDDDNDSADGGGGDESATTETTAFTLDLGGDAGDEPDFKEVEDYSVRFVNLYWTDGEGVPIDLYWGSDPETGEKFDTLEYGEVSDYVAPKYDANTLIEQEGSATFTMTLEGETDEDSVLWSSSEGLSDQGKQYTYVLSATSDEVDGRLGPQLGTILETGDPDYAMGEPPSGKGALFLSTVGLHGIEEDVPVFDWGTEVGSCLEADTEELSAVNAGYPFPVDPPSVTVYGFADANCEMQIMDATDIDVEEGQRVLVFAYATSEDDIQLVAAPVED